MSDDNTGFMVAPQRYNTRDRETIDLIRDECQKYFIEALQAGCAVADAAFCAYCGGAVLKYESRAGLKGSAEEDLRKAEWYREMIAHVMHPDTSPDPRRYREDFRPYTREVPKRQELLPFNSEATKLRVSNSGIPPEVAEQITRELSCSMGCYVPAGYPKVGEAAAKLFHEKLKEEAPGAQHLKEVCEAAGIEIHCNCLYMMGSDKKVTDFCRIHGKRGEEAP